MASDLMTQVHNSDDDAPHHADDHIADDTTNTSLLYRILCCMACRQDKSMSANSNSAHHSVHLSTKSSSNIGAASNKHSINASPPLNNNVGGGGANSLVHQVAQTPIPKTNGAVNSIHLSQPVAPQPQAPLAVSPQMNGSLPQGKFLLPPLSREEIMSNKKTLVLDLDETLIHSSFKPIPNADFVLSIDLDGVTHRIYVRKRPGVDHFLRQCGEKFEVVVFTASLAKYADPLLDILDRDHIVKVRLFREACVQHYNNYIKDLTHLGRKLENTIIVDNSPFSYMFQPENAIPITSWFNDKNDRQLYDLLPHLDHMADCNDIVAMIAAKKLQFINGQVIAGQ